MTIFNNFVFSKFLGWTFKVKDYVIFFIQRGWEKLILWRDVIFDCYTFPWQPYACHS